MIHLHSRIVSMNVSRAKRVLQLAMSVLMVVSGIGHLFRPEGYLALMPPQLPEPLALVYLSGVIELVLGIMLLFPRTMRLSAWGIVITLIAVYPANIYHAISGGISDPALPEVFASATAAYVRLPLQFILVVWAWSLTRPLDRILFRDTAVE